jgi:hypothetical protein
MPKKLTTPVGPFRTGATVFEKGKERPIEITLYPLYVEVRAVGIPNRYHVLHSSILRLGAESQVHHRIRRGAIGGPR